MYQRQVSFDKVSGSAPFTKKKRNDLHLSGKIWLLIEQTKTFKTIKKWIKL